MRYRYLFALAALLLLGIVAWLSPSNALVIAYKLAVATCAAVLGYYLDLGMLPYAQPSHYLRGSWRREVQEHGWHYAARDRANFPVAEGCEKLFIAACLRRAGMVCVFVYAASAGL